VVMIPQEMSLRTAAHLFSQHQISGAPVVDGNGRCLGVLSTSDFVHWADKNAGRKKVDSSACHCAWQVVHEVNELPADQVANYMTLDPVTIPPHVDIRTLSQMMVDAHIHRVIVVDKERKPIGIVSSTDILAAVAKADFQSRTVTDTHEGCADPHIMLKGAP
jgi:CBS domain-containing protein